MIKIVRTLLMLDCERREEREKTDGDDDDDDGSSLAYAPGTWNM